MPCHTLAIFTLVSSPSFHLLFPSSILVYISFIFIFKYVYTCSVNISPILSDGGPLRIHSHPLLGMHGDDGSSMLFYHQEIALEKTMRGEERGGEGRGERGWGWKRGMVKEG